MPGSRSAAGGSGFASMTFDRSFIRPVCEPGFTLFGSNIGGKGMSIKGKPKKTKPTQNPVPTDSDILDPNELRKRIKAVAEEMQGSEMNLALLLEQASIRKLYKDWGYDSFEEYVSDDLGMDGRKCYYLISIVEQFRKSNTPIEVLERIGWTKSRAIAPMLTGPDGPKWVERAGRTPRSELEKQVQEAKGGEVFHTMHFRLAEEQFEVVQEALAVAKIKAKSDKPGHLLTCLAMDFLSNITDERGQALEWWVKKLEQVYSARVFIVDKTLPDAGEKIEQCEALMAEAAIAQSAQSK